MGAYLEDSLVVDEKVGGLQIAVQHSLHVADLDATQQLPEIALHLHTQRTR